MTDADVFKSEFVPNVQGSNVAYPKWRQQNPGEAAKWDAYRDAILAGGSPTPPALVTKFGKALVAAGKMAYDAQPPPPPPPPPPPSSTTLKGVSYMRWGNGELPTAHANDYDTLFVSWSGASAAGALLARSAVYMSAVSCLSGQAWHYGVTGEDAVANGWVLKEGTRLLRNASYTASYIGDPGSTGYQQKWADNVISLCQGWKVDGVFIDDFYGSLSLADGTPDRYPTLTQQRAALASFIAAIYPRLHAAGLRVWTNSAVYEGQAGDDDGSTTLPWWQTIVASVDGLVAEYWQWRDNSPDCIRRSGTAWYQNWDGWQRLPAFCEANGKEFLGILYADDYGRPASDKMYVLCSALLETSRGSIIGGTSSLNPWTSTYDRLPLGAPQGVKTKNGNRWQRQYVNGLVWVDPVAGTAGIT